MFFCSGNSSRAENKVEHRVPRDGMADVADFIYEGVVLKHILMAVKVMVLLN